MIGIVVSHFNESLTSKLLEGALSRLHEKGVDRENVSVIQVPGAIEIPLVAKKLAQNKKYKSIIALGVVIRGETSHYDYVCEQVSQGCQQVMLQYEVPVIFGVLTTENREQALERLGGNHGHKGCDAADAALEMIRIMDELENVSNNSTLV